VKLRYPNNVARVATSSTPAMFLLLAGAVHFCLELQLTILGAWHCSNDSPAAAAIARVAVPAVFLPQDPRACGLNMWCDEQDEDHDDRPDALRHLALPSAAPPPRAARTRQGGGERGERPFAISFKPPRSAEGMR
jgi:hypothetical protein